MKQGWQSLDFGTIKKKAQEVISENNDLKAKFETFHELAESISDLGVSLELLQEIPDDEELQADLEENYQHAENCYNHIN